jgi:hypothetical protein
MTPVNPFAVLGLPDWPDLDDETVDAAWAAIAAETDPARADGGNLARYTQAAAAYTEIRSHWGRTEAFADLLDQAWADGRYDAYPGHYPPGHEPDDEPPGPDPWHTELGPVPWSEVVHLVAEIPARFRRGHPARLTIQAAVITALCLALCCPTLKIAMKAALAIPMWGCCKAPQPWWLRGLGGGGAGGGG